MVRFTRPGHALNHVGKNAAVNPKLQARPVEPSQRPARADADLTLRRSNVSFPLDGDNSLKRRP
jgi:hypothetical protein